MCAFKLDDVRRADPNHPETYREVCDNWEASLKDGYDFGRYMDRHSRDIADWLLVMKRMLQESLFTGEN